MMGRPSTLTAMRKLIVAAALALCVPCRAQQAFRSGPARVRLLELYGSEGCSSCPPADAWLASLRAAPGLWKEFVPAAFAVDYWDYLGWKDRFAAPEWTARQRAYAAAWGRRSVYTPGLVLDGQEFRDWGGAPPAAGEDVGGLEAVLTGKTLRVHYAAPDSAGLTVYAVRLGMGLISDVTAGENAGRILRHDFMVRALVHAPLKSDGTAVLELPAAAGPKAESEALAVWIAGKDGRPVQAAGGALNRAAAGSAPGSAPRRRS